ncbi:MAG: FMN-binding negative transcriptional regulator, partial [Actinomycetota bacterium]
VHLVSSGSNGFQVTSLPMVVDRESGRLAGHLARANTHWRQLDGKTVVAIAVASEAYVSPSWYRTKSESGGRVVPTWNYEAVHVHGVAQLHQDTEWLSDLVRRTTDVHESRRSDGSDRWRVDDAPDDFIDRQLAAIVGVSVSLDRIDAKQKMSANRSVADRAGVIAGLSATEGSSPRMIDVMSNALDAELQP